MNDQVRLHPNSIEGWLQERIGTLVGLRPSEISVHKPIANYGVDSAEAAALAEDLEQWLARQIPLDLVWEWASSRELAERVCEHFLIEEAGK